MVIIGDRSVEDMEIQDFNIGDTVVCRPESSDVISKFSLHTCGMKKFSGSFKIVEISGDKCAIGGLLVGYH